MILPPMLLACCSDEFRHKRADSKKQPGGLLSQPSPPHMPLSFTLGLSVLVLCVIHLQFYDHHLHRTALMSNRMRRKPSTAEPLSSVATLWKELQNTTKDLGLLLLTDYQIHFVHQQPFPACSAPSCQLANAVAQV